MNILGISCFYHDSAACLFKGGKIVAAEQEERFNRRKHYPGFPIQAINFCLQSAGINIYDIDYIGFYEKPYLKFSRVVTNHLQSWPFSLKNFLNVMPGWLEDRLIMPDVFQRELGFKGKTIFIKHHLAHAASSFFVSPFEDAAVFTADGVGEWSTTSCGFGRGNRISILKEINYPDSLGLLYTAITTYLGFEALEGEGKVMGLAGYGRPAYLSEFRKMAVVKPDGSFKLNQEFFGFFNQGSRMYNSRLLKLLGADRKPESEIDQRHCDIAASLQEFIEDSLIKIANRLYEETGSNNLCLSGGLFLNCVANQKILEETPFKKVFIQPAAGDSGGALGAAAYINNVICGDKREYVMCDAGLGQEYPRAQIKRILELRGLVFKELDYPDLAKYVARNISQDKIVGWFQGKAEFGPRALGNRSILANPCNPNMKDLLNSKVKNRESFRPYAPAVLEEKAGDYFWLKDLSPFMLLAPQVKEDKKHLIPAVTHVDGTARVQTINKDVNPKFWQLVREFEIITGVPVLINTSFNLRGEPIVNSPEEAIDSFLKTGMDCLVLGDFIVEKSLI
ncbi:MAG: carbamoyltransferase [Candidatus Omnitrophica bacterium]|jgi:carbamoyltransferase|nr:carbamoyltransferase [Candidatus Omnitrophota bacterium]MDD5079956.1 carbamoyltransferase [Candidatus Omnitrophota bacterium]